MPSKIKRAVVQLPIASEEFEPISKWFEEHGIVMGRTVLNYLKSVSAGKTIHAVEGITHPCVGSTTAKGKTS